MTIFLIRHAHAVDADEDPERPLSKRGEDLTRIVGRAVIHNDQLGS